MRWLLELAWRDLRAGGRPLVVFAACLALGVALVAAGSGLHRQVAGALQADVRAVFGGDVEIESGQPLPADVQAWVAARGAVAQVVELRTMLRADDGRSQLVELMAVDGAYPLVGTLALEPAQPLAHLLAERDGRWGVALDPVLARRLGLQPGSTLSVGDATLQLRALVQRQPDRSLRAEWRGAPVLLAAGALPATGLVQPLSRVEWQTRVRLADGADPLAWRDAFVAAFPALQAEVQTVADRSDRIAEVLGQIASGLLLVGCSALFIGGLGVFNSVQAWLRSRLATLATLRALGLRDARLAALVLLQVTMLALAASMAGALLGAMLVLGGLQLAADRLPVPLQAQALVGPSLAAIAFGVLTAIAFALPALGRALGVHPAVLFRGADVAPARTPPLARRATAVTGLAVVAALLLVLPDARYGLAFVAAVLLLLALLEGVLRGLRAGAGWALARPGWQPSFELRVALAGLARPGSPLRVALLSLGSALTLLVASTVVLATLLRTVDDTLPREAPALVMHDVQQDQLGLVADTLAAAPSLQRQQTAPLVLGRLVAVNGAALGDSEDGGRRLEARDEHKLSHRSGNLDDVVVTRGAWWPDGHRGAPKVAMEDREADQLGLQVGDRLRFDIQGTMVEAELVAIYAQRRLQARLWLEAMFSDGVLDPFITRHVGAAWMSAEDAIVVQDRLAALAPNIATVRTQVVVETTRGLMTRAAAGLAVVGGVCLAASLLVLASVVGASRARQQHEAAVMHALGARLASLRRVLVWEYALLGLVTTVFATLAGSALALALLRLQVGLQADGLLWTGLAVAALTSALSLLAGGRVTLAGLRVTPARLLRGTA